MYQKHRSFRTPPLNVEIWHYFNLPKFLWLIHTSQLYFARTDQFDDAKEGKVTQTDITFWNRFGDNFYENFISNDKIGCFYVNCWFIADKESYLMWKAYSSTTEGIAIKSNVEQLINSLDPSDNRDVYCSCVRYLKDENDSVFVKSDNMANLMAPYFSKRAYFSDERELRLLYSDANARFNSSPKGLNFKVDIAKLISEIYIAPQSQKWYQELVNIEVSKAGLDPSIIKKSGI